MLAMAHSPTGRTKQPNFGETRDLSNPCIAIFDQAVQGSQGIAMIDRTPYRLFRSNDLQTPEDLLPVDLLRILAKIWPIIWEASNASTAVLLGKQQVEDYRAKYPDSTPMTLYDKLFYGSSHHVFLEWAPDSHETKIRRLVFVIYHMESWLKQIWPQTIIGIKESLSSALLFAFPTWNIGETWNLPMQALDSAEQLLQAILGGKQMSFQIGLNKFYDVFDISVRLMIAEHIAGVTGRSTCLGSARAQRHIARCRDCI